MSISKYNPLIKNTCLEIAFVEIICKGLLKPNSRAPLVNPKIVSFVKIACQISKLC